MINREPKKLKKLTSYVIIFGLKTFFSIIKHVFPEKQSYLFYYNYVFKDKILFKYTQLNIEVDTIVVKKHISFKFC